MREKEPNIYPLLDIFLIALFIFMASGHRSMDKSVLAVKRKLDNASETIVQAEILKSQLSEENKALTKSNRELERVRENLVQKVIGLEKSLQEENQRVAACSQKNDELNSFNERIRIANQGFRSGFEELAKMLNDTDLMAAISNYEEPTGVSNKIIEEYKESPKKLGELIIAASTAIQEFKTVVVRLDKGNTLNIGKRVIEMDTFGSITELAEEIRRTMKSEYSGSTRFIFFQSCGDTITAGTEQRWKDAVSELLKYGELTILLNPMEYP